MQKIVVVYGGKSTEHDVSILTGLHLAQHITEDYQVRLVYLTRENKFVYGTRNLDAYISGQAAKARPFRKWHQVACVINCCHGGAGEDGTLAATMKLYNVPITSCDQVAAAMQQSKIATRQILTAAGFKQPKFVIVNGLDALSQIDLPLPLIVKPDTQGSSIGVVVVKTKDELTAAVVAALQMGPRVIVEEYFAQMREVNVAVMRQHGTLVTSGLELVGNKKFFSFDEKYFNTQSGFIKKSTTSPDDVFLAQIAPQIKDLAKRAYQLFGSSGVVRSDFMVVGDQIILNENNTVPGFMAYHLWLKEKIPYGVIIEHLIQEAIAQHRQTKQYLTRFDSDILTKNRQLLVE